MLGLRLDATIASAHDNTPEYSGARARSGVAPARVMGPPVCQRQGPVVPVGSRVVMVADEPRVNRLGEAGRRVEGQAPEHTRTRGSLPARGEGAGAGVLAVVSRWRFYTTCIASDEAEFNTAADDFLSGLPLVP